MLKRHIGHLAIVSLKYFFDIDYAFCTNALLTVLVLIGSCRLLIAHFSTAFYDGILTIKEDAIEIKQNILTLKENWDNSRTRETLINNLRSIKNLAPQKMS